MVADCFFSPRVVLVSRLRGMEQGCADWGWYGIAARLLSPMAKSGQLCGAPVVSTKSPSVGIDKAAIIDHSLSPSAQWTHRRLAPGDKMCRSGKGAIPHDLPPSPGSVVPLLPLLHLASPSRTRLTHYREEDAIQPPLRERHPCSQRQEANVSVFSLSSLVVSLACLLAAAISGETALGRRPHQYDESSKTNA
jgi:hypothetical protein